MLSKITSEELQFMEDFHDPVAFAECMFSDFDNLQSMTEDFGHVRNGQLSMLSYEYQVDDSPELTDKENFKMREGSGAIYNFGSRSYGKCEYEENYCILASGERVKFKDLIGQEKKVLSLDETTLKLEKSKARFFDNGIKDCIKIVTSSGKEIIVTENHPLYTNLGWKKSSELNISDFIGTIREYNFKGVDVDENVVKILAYLLGDGSTNHCAIGFTNTNKELLNEFFQLLDYFECSYRKRGIEYFIKNKVRKYKYIDKNPRLQKNNIQKIVLEYGINKLSKHKTIPREVFRWDKKYLKLFLNRLFACDGYITKSSNTVGIALASEKMISQIGHLLLRFGIHSVMNKKIVELNNKFFDSWNLAINMDAYRFMTEIGIKSKEKDFVFRKTLFTNADPIPKNFILDIYDSFENKKLSRAWGLKVYNPSRRKCLKLNEIIKNKEFGRIITSDIYWDRIKSIEFLKSLKTVAVEVPKYHNYISNDIISHNTLVSLIIDMLMSSVHLTGWKTIFSSYDAVHIRKVLEQFIPVCESHPVLKQFEPKSKRSPTYFIRFKNGFVIESVNMNIVSKTAGNQFFGHHVKKHWMEESSKENLKVEEKRIDAVSELGCIERFSGMTDFTRYSPAGKIFDSLEKRPWLCNFPQYINPTWDEKKKKQAIKRHGGESSVGFRIFVKGEVVTEGSVVFDMERVQKNYDEDRVIKHIELPKEQFDYFRDKLIVERPKNAEVLYMAADIGESAPTEIIFISKVNDIYKYLYNITLYNLTDKQQFEVFRYLAEKANVNYIGLDCSIPPDEFILCKVGNKIKNIEIKDLEKETKDIFVPTFNNQKLEWKKARLAKHFFKGKIKKFVLNTGNLQVRVTDNHSMMIFTEGGLEEKLASECNLNDWVLSPKNYKFKNKQQFVKFRKQDKNQFCFGEEVTIPVDEDLAYLLGWAVAEGSEKYSYQFSLGDEEEYCKEILSLGRKIFGFNSGYIQKRTPEEANKNGGSIDKRSGRKILATVNRYTTVFGGGRNIGKFFEFHVGKGSHNKKVPEVILNSPENVQESFIKGYFRGDGCETKNEHDTTHVWGHTTSYTLANQLFFLCRLLGKYPGFISANDDSYFVGFSNKPLKGRWDGVPWRVIPLKNGKGRINRKTTSLERCRCSKEKRESFTKLSEGDWCFHKIKKIKSEDYEGFVYDLVVDDNHTFCAGLGNILVHNSDGTGRAIFRRLEEIYSRDNLNWVSFQAKIPIDFEKDEFDKVVYKDGNPVYREEYVAEWSIKHLKEDLLYAQKMYLPLDYKLDSQLTGVISLQSGNRTVYTCKEEEDHLLSAFRVFSIMHWDRESHLVKPITGKTFSKFGA